MTQQRPAGMNGWARRARKVLVAAVGFTVLAGGVVLIVLPGPAILVIPLGLAILATEFFWARKLLDSVRSITGRRKAVASDRSPPTG